MLFYMKKQKDYSSGNAPIYLRITVIGSLMEITIGQECKPERWNPKTERLTGTKEDIKGLMPIWATYRRRFIVHIKN